MPGAAFIAVWAVAIALLTKGFFDKSERGEWSVQDKVGASAQRALFQTTDLTRALVESGDTSPLSIISERVILARCGPLGLDCNKHVGVIARSALLDTGAELTCVSLGLAHAVNASKSFAPGVRVAGITGDVQSYPRTWLMVSVRGKPQLAHVCILDPVASAHLSADVIVGRDILSSLFAGGLSLS